MTRYIVLERGGPQDIVFLKDNFRVLAFAFPVFWFLAHRMWREAVLAVLALVVVSVLVTLAGVEALSGFLVLLVQFGIGFEAQALRVSSLKRRGYQAMAAIVSGSVEEAEIRYFHGRGTRATGPLGDRRSRGSLVPSIGLFS